MTACASVEAPEEDEASRPFPPSPGTTAGTDGADATGPSGTGGSDAEPTPSPSPAGTSSSPPGVPSSESEPSSGPPPPTATDPRAFCDDEWIGECERPFSRDCSADGTGIVLCGACGDVIRLEQQCPRADVCDNTVDGGPICRRCVGDECPEDVEDCEDGERGCFAWNQPWRCVGQRIRPDGACTGGRMCLDGTCTDPALRPNGGSCDYAEQCQGDLCLCGVDFGTTATEPGCQFLQEGMCAKRDCIRDGCDPDREACVDWSVNRRYGGGPACMRRDDCRVEGAGCGTRGSPNDRCRFVPTRSGPEAAVQWGLVCMPDNLARIGEACLADAPDAPSDCVGGRCHVFQRGTSQESTYCTAGCGVDGDCPSGTACVEVRGEYLCLVRSTGADDPRCAGFNLRTETRAVHGQSGNASVCYYFQWEPER